MASAVARIRESTAWLTVGRPIASVLSDFLDVDLVEVLDDPPPDALGADVVLTDTARMLTVGATVLVDPASAHELGARVFGVELHDDAHAAAIALEAARLVGLTIEDTLDREGYVLTSGIPANVGAVRAEAMLDAARVRRRFALAAGDSRIHVWTRADAERARPFRLSAAQRLRQLEDE